MYYFFAYKKQAGCHSYLGTLLHDTLEAAVAEQPMSYSWAYASPGGKVTGLPGHLWMIAKHAKYDFAIKSGCSGFIVSEAFVDVMSRCACGHWEKAKLSIQLKKGAPVSDKQYYYIRQRDEHNQMPSDVVDIERSDIYLRKDGTVRQMRSLVFTGKQKQDLFMLSDNYEYLFCSQRFADAILTADPKGFQLLPVSNLKLDDLVLV